MVSNEVANRLREKANRLEAENKELREALETLTGEFRVCRWCMHKHEDCSPTDGSCKPRWGGL